MMLCEGIKQIKSCNVNESWVVVSQLAVIFLPPNSHFYLVFVFSSSKSFKIFQTGSPRLKHTPAKAFPVHELRLVSSFSCCETMNYEITAI